MKGLSASHGVAMLATALLTILILSACGPTRGAEPTLGPEAIFTSAYETFVAQKATEQAAVTPTLTPLPLPSLTPSPFPTFALIATQPALAFSGSTPSTEVSGSAACKNWSAWIADVTVPDNTIFTPGEDFVKTWRVQNSGTCAWNTEYSLQFRDGMQMAGKKVLLPISVPPGQQVEISVKLEAPDDIGSFYGRWVMHDADGQGFRQLPERGDQGGRSRPVSPVHALRLEQSKSRPALSSRLMQRSRLGGRPLLLAVTLALVTGCTSPRDAASPTLDAPAIFTRAAETFSADAATREAFRAVTDTPEPTAMASPSSTSSSIRQSACDNAAYVSDVTVPDGTLVAAGSAFTKTWMLQNSGACAWSLEYRLTFVGGDQLAGQDAPLTEVVPSGGQSAVSVQLAAPMAPGSYAGQWQMKNAHGQAFGSVVTVVIDVGAPAECKRSSKTTITIMGHAGPENTTIDYGLGTTVTDQHGDYAFQVPEGWSGTVTPSKAKVNPWSFTPPFRTYSNVQCDLRNENYKAKAPPGV